MGCFHFIDNVKLWALCLTLEILMGGGSTHSLWNVSSIGTLIFFNKSLVALRWKNSVIHNWIWMFKVIFLFVAGDSIFTFFSSSPCWRKASSSTSEQEMSSVNSVSGSLLLLSIPNWAKIHFFFTVEVELLITDFGLLWVITLLSAVQSSPCSKVPKHFVLPVL